jgi:hypothetical protein
VILEGVTAMEKKVRHLGKTLDLKSRTTGTRDRTFWMEEACAHRWASGWGATGSGTMGRVEGGGGRLGLRRRSGSG